jgi:phosphatidate cytidylyltransferase
MNRLLDVNRAFAHPVTLWITAGIGILLAVASVTVWFLPVAPELRTDLRRRTLSWMIMAPLIVGPILLGAGPTVLAMTLLSLACFREYARATGLFRERAITAVVVLCMLLVSAAALDHWYPLFVALAPLGVVLIAATAIAADEPKGYIQRVGLGVLGFLLFGISLGHVSYMAVDANYRPIVLMLLLGVQMNDVFAYCTGKAFGRRKLAPNTSPNKTVAGSLGALALTTPLVAVLGHFVFRGTTLDHPYTLAVLGFVTSVAGQLDDLMLSSIKRDIGIKDMGALIPGHGGVLDRANSILLAAPAVFHFVGYFERFGADRSARFLF